MAGYIINIQMPPGDASHSNKLARLAELIRESTGQTPVIKINKSRRQNDNFNTKQ